MTTSVTKRAVASMPYSSRNVNAIVVSSGLMEKTVKVSVGIQEWNSHIRKKFSRNRYLLVHDPKTSLRTGDVISISPGWRVSKTVHHVVSSIIAPFGPPISERPAVPTLAERLAEREEAARRKAERKGRALTAEAKVRKERTRQEIMQGIDIDAVVEREWEVLKASRPKSDTEDDAEFTEWKRLRKQQLMLDGARRRMMKETEAFKNTKANIERIAAEKLEARRVTELDATVAALEIDTSSRLSNPLS